ncbi:MULTISPECIES: hypothetical protein [Methylobacteriaceae]|uniref:hypothetical protein n=1 Tax=Methylobacteriaceae TaxID=119045 RepID=UPI002F3516FB
MNLPQEFAGFLSPSFDHAMELDGRDALSPMRLLRAVCTPANLLLCAVVAFGWFALIGWTGAGPDGFQARLCADLDLQPRACAAVQSMSDAGRATGTDSVRDAS